jgi:hypothetical protein
MPDPKQQLTELIEAYAIARATGNQLLIQSAGAGLIGFLENCTISTDVAVEPAAEEDGGQG